MSLEHQQSRTALNHSVKINRFEFIIVIVASCCIIVLPIVYTEAFPLTSTPMFAYPLHLRYYYSLSDVNGNKLNNDIYGIRVNPNSYLEEFYAVKYPENVIGSASQKPDFERICSHIQKVANEKGTTYPLSLTCEVWGPVSDQQVGLLETQRIEITSETWRRIDEIEN